jgi:predicted membrane GTPase involved in stress response
MTRSYREDDQELSPEEQREAISSRRMNAGSLRMTIPIAALTGLAGFGGSWVTGAAARDRLDEKILRHDTEIAVIRVETANQSAYANQQLAEIKLMIQELRQESKTERVRR